MYDTYCQPNNTHCACSHILIVRHFDRDEDVLHAQDRILSCWKPQFSHSSRERNSIGKSQRQTGQSTHSGQQCERQRACLRATHTSILEYIIPEHASHAHWHSGLVFVFLLQCLHSSSVTVECPVSSSWMQLPGTINIPGGQTLVFTVCWNHEGISSLDHPHQLSFVSCFRPVVTIAARHCTYR